MDHKLAALSRRLKMEDEPAPATKSGLGAQIEKLIDQRIEQVMAQHHEQMMPTHVQRMLDRQFSKPSMPISDYRQLPPVARTPAPKAMELQFQRDELGRIALVDVGFCQWRVQRNGLGQIVRMVPADIAPMPPAIEPPFLASAREYKEL